VFPKGEQFQEINVADLCKNTCMDPFKVLKQISQKINMHHLDILSLSEEQIQKNTTERR
jgi:hypothetical protein